MNLAFSYYPMLLWGNISSSAIFLYVHLFRFVIIQRSLLLLHWCHFWNFSFLIIFVMTTIYASSNRFFWNCKALFDEILVSMTRSEYKPAVHFLSILKLFKVSIRWMISRNLLKLLPVCHLCVVFSLTFLGILKYDCKINNKEIIDLLIYFVILS